MEIGDRYVLANRSAYIVACHATKQLTQLYNKNRNANRATPRIRKGQIPADQPINPHTGCKSRAQPVGS